MLKSLRYCEGKEPVLIDATIFPHHAFVTHATPAEFLNRVEVSNIKAYTSALVLEECAHQELMIPKSKKTG